MTDLDYAKTIGRLGLGTGDTTDDVDKNPDLIWCDYGTIRITPLITFAKVAGATTPFTMGGAVIDCQVSQDTDPEADNYYADGAGYLLYNGDPYVNVVDLTSDKINPHIGDDAATHRIQFIDVQADGTPVPFPTFTCRLTAAGDGVSPGAVNDLAVVAPVTPGTVTPIYRGEPGTSIADLAVTGGNLVATLTDGTEVDAGPLPVGPGGSDAGVAGYIATPGTATELALTTSTADSICGSSGSGLTPQQAVDARAKAVTGAWVQAAGAAAVGAGIAGPNLIRGYSGNAVASDLGDTTIGGGGHSGRENIIGIGDVSTIGTTSPNVAATGTNANYSILTGGYDNGAGGLMSVISGAHNYTKTTTTHGTLSGGSFHSIKNGDYHVIAGGTLNNIDTSGGSRCTIGGGSDNAITGTISGATIAGGRSNTASASQASIGGGLSNNASGDRSTIAGGNSNAASGQYASVGGGSGNTASGARSTVSGGSGNTASQQGATIAGGENNNANGGVDCTVGGGNGNTAGAQYATVAGGKSNQANTSAATVAGGELNIAQTNSHATISGGLSNTASGQYSAIAGGNSNTASGTNAFVYGSNNTASGGCSTAGGLRSKATRYGQRAYAAGYFAAVGDAQISDLVARRVTSNATPTELRIDGGSTQLVLDDDTSWGYRLMVVARNTATDTESAVYHVKGGIRRGSGAANTALIGTPTIDSYEDSGIAAAWDLSVTADTTNGALSIKGSGEAAKNIQWVARVELVETTG